MRNRLRVQHVECERGMPNTNPDTNTDPGVGSARLAPPICIRLAGERSSSISSDERLVFQRDDDDAAVADGVAAAILLRVVADERAARDQHVAVDDGAADLRVPADADARHQDHCSIVAEAVHPDVGAEHAAAESGCPR